MYDETIGSTGANEVLSLLNELLLKLEVELGKHDQLIVWCDNSPAQFKENFLFFFMEHMIKETRFLRIDLKFLLEGHSYSICDRRFGSIQKVFDSRETIELPQQWATILRDSGLSNVKVHWVTQEMIKDYKSFLKLEYVSRNKDTDEQKFEVRKLAWLNFGYGEILDSEGGELCLVHHPGTVFLRFCINPKEKPSIVCYQKRKQLIELKPEFLTIWNQEMRPVRKDVKESCVKIAKKYLSTYAERFYSSLQCCENEDENENA